MKYTWWQAIIAVAVLVLLHTGLWLMPGPTISPSINLALFATNIYVLHCVSGLFSEKSPKNLILFILGYGFLFVLLMVVLKRQPLFILLIIVYASIFRSPYLLGFFGIFVFSFVIAQPYAAETFIPLVFIYIVLARVRKASRFLRNALAFGLLALGCVLLPLISLAISDSAQTLWHTLKRPDVLNALMMSLGTATVATIIVSFWGIPLAYALARLSFSGRRVIETIIDVPILVPQSVAGIALMVLLGPGSPIGSSLEKIFGIQVAGSILGIVVAQIFMAAPFLIKSALAAFAAVPLELEHASRTLGASFVKTFWRIAIPLAGRGIFIGMILAFARAISEFGAIILFAPSPVTAPVLAHTEFLRAGISESRPIAVLLLITCLWVFCILQLSAVYLPFGKSRNPGVSL
ncbi:MAG: ABC transporter permease [Deltaproteobacteria bacterium]|nr:ABC transporter permease [Deltaproteobacteria bacterium]